MGTKIALWPYVPATKHEIIESAMMKDAALLFCNENDLQNYELIDSTCREFDTSCEHFLEKAKGSKKPLHILYMNRAMAQKLARLLEKKRVSYIMKDINFPV